MENIILEKINIILDVLQGMDERTRKLTSGNMAHSIPSIRSITRNIGSAILQDTIRKCQEIGGDENDSLKGTIERIGNGMEEIDITLQRSTAKTISTDSKAVEIKIQQYIKELKKNL